MGKKNQPKRPTKTGPETTSSGADKLNPDQHMNEGHIRKLVGDKDTQQSLLKLVNNDVKFVLSNTGSSHHMLKIIGDGMVIFSKSPGTNRSVKNAMHQVRRQIRQTIDPDWDFPK